MPDVIAAIEEVAKATAAISGEVTQRDKEGNTVAMVAAKKSQSEQAVKDKVNTEIATGNIAAERKDDAE